MGRDDRWQRRPDDHDWYNPSEGFRNNRPDHRDRYDSRDGRRYHDDVRERGEGEYAPYDARELGDRYFQYDNRSYNTEDGREQQTGNSGRSAGGGMNIGRNVDRVADDHLDFAKPGQSSGASAGEVVAHVQRDRGV